MVAPLTRFTVTPFDGFPCWDVEMQVDTKWGSQVISVELLADGYRRVVTVPIELISGGWQFIEPGNYSTVFPIPDWL